MCFTRRANKKISKLTKLKNTKIFPTTEEYDDDTSSPKFDNMLPETSTEKTNTKDKQSTPNYNYIHNR